MAAPAALYELIETTDGVDYTQFVVLETSDSKMIKIARQAIDRSNVMKRLLPDDEGGEAKIPLASVDSATMECVAQYLVNYMPPKNPTLPEKPLKTALPELLGDWDKNFVFTILFKDGDEKQNQLLLKTLKASIFLEIDPLRDLCRAAVANMLRGRNLEGIMEVFGVTEPFTPEEEAAVDAEYPWAREAGDQ